MGGQGHTQLRLTNNCETPSRESGQAKQTQPRKKRIHPQPLYCVWVKTNQVSDFDPNICKVQFLNHFYPESLHPTRRNRLQGRYLDDGLGQVHALAQQPVEVVPLLLQRPQIHLQLSLRLLVAHGEELAANLQSVDEGALVPVEQQLCVLEGEEETGLMMLIGE